MKLFKKLNMYKASNVTFNPETEQAHSYSHWLFVSRINGLLVFNNYTYSNSTSKHQSKVRALLSDLGIKINISIECPRGLDRLESSVQWYESKIEKLNNEISKKGSKHSKNIERLELINLHMEKIETVKELMQSQQLRAV